MRRTATRHRRGRVAVHRIGGMFGAVIGDDWRALGVSAEVETAAGILPDVDFIGEAPGFPPNLLSLRSRILDLGGYRTAAADFRLGMGHGESRNLAGDRPAFRLIGVQNGRR